jgi:hypothetical protein
MNKTPQFPNDYRIPIPKVVKGIDLIAGRRYPIILCQCGNKDQRLFIKARLGDVVVDKEKPWKKRTIYIDHVRCKKCGETIPKVDFDMKAQKLVQESKLKFKKQQDEKQVQKNDGKNIKPKKASNTKGTKKTTASGKRTDGKKSNGSIK